MTQQFEVKGMTCGHCVKAVTRAIQDIDAAARVDVDLATGQVTVESTLDRARISAAIRDEGYAVS